MKKKNNLIGAQVSIAGNFNKALNQAKEIDANCIQIFTKSNRQWKAKKITDKEIEMFLKEKESSNVLSIIAHASYLINLGSTNSQTIHKSIDALAIELERCEALKIPYLILHPGTKKYNDDEKKSLEFIAKNLDDAIKKSKTKKTLVLLETMAGQGSTVGNTFEQLATIIKASGLKKRIGVCFDTCHAFVAGYKFTSESDYKNMWHHFDKTIGLKKLKAFHINDSKKEADSHVDRHENILNGKIPENVFSMIINDKRFRSIPKVVETPIKNGLKDHAKDIKTLKNLEK